MVVTSRVITKLAKGNTDTDEVNWSGGINVVSDFDDIQARGVHGTRVDSINSPPHVPHHLCLQGRIQRLEELQRTHERGEKLKIKVVRLQ